MARRPRPGSGTRVVLFGNLSGLIWLLNDDVARPCLDHRLDVGRLVTGHDDEPPGMRPDVLVLADAQLDQLVTAELSAFAAKADRGVLLSRPLPALDALVDVANRRLVCAGALLPLALHDWDPLTPIA